MRPSGHRVFGGGSHSSRIINAAAETKSPRTKPNLEKAAAMARKRLRKIPAGARNFDGVVVHFEDRGQDFLRWWIKGGEVVASWPFQGSLWAGRGVSNLSRLDVGGFVTLAADKAKDHERLTIKYPIVRVVAITDTISLCPTCGQTHDRGPVNGGNAYRCLACGQTRDGRIPKLREKGGAR
jgi:hypothetical protein